MPKFKYTAMDSRGVESQGEVDADNQTAALSKIREKGLFPTNVVDATAAAAKPGKKTAEQTCPGKFEKIATREGTIHHGHFIDFI